MKHLIILLFVLNISAQQIAIGLDISNALYGSDVNIPNLDIQAKISDVTANREIGLASKSCSSIIYTYRTTRHYWSLCSAYRSSRCI